MDMPSNGGMLYHEVQESKLCALHCINTVLQGPYFTEVDLADLASDLDSTERQMMTPPSTAISSGDALPDQSHNVSLDGNFSIQVLERALQIYNMQVIPLHSPVAETAQVDPDKENAFICHLQDHWFCIRKANGEWYNFDSLYAAPEHLSKFYLAAHLDTLKGYGWSIFIVRGNFPAECPDASEPSNGYGQWLTPEDADRIFKSCNQPSIPGSKSHPSQDRTTSRTIEEAEDEDLKAAIAASLMNSSSPTHAEASSHAHQDTSDEQE